MTAMSTYVASLYLLSLGAAQFFPTTPRGATVLTSTFDAGIKVSYKYTSSICETTPDVKSFSGYVSMSPSSLVDVNGSPGYNVNYFYWFFESRKDPVNAPFVIWLGGGPGYSSVASALNENGPCNVNEDSNSTTLNPWSWNNEANLLYIDQPSMVGYSFDTLANATVDGLNASLPIIIADFSKGVPSANNTFQVGTFATQNPAHIANSTGNAAPVVWNFVQAWFAEFPQYKPQNNSFNIWTESYGGHYGPLIAKFFTQQNAKITAGTLKAQALVLDSLGIINGYIDPILHAKSYPQMTFNNTYNIQAVPKLVSDSMQLNLTKPGGCIEQLTNCQSLAKADPLNHAVNVTIDGTCAEAFIFCEIHVQKAYNAVSKRSQDDIAHSSLDPFPPQYYNGFFNQAWVQRALGSPVNFTANSGPILDNFLMTGDLARAGALENIGQLLDMGVQVTLLYGDRDYQVNWLGGEQVSLAIPHAGATAFRDAGYQNISISGSHVGGVVRQAGNLSFSRIFQSGHQVPSYQPELAYGIYMRAMNHMDIAEGKVDIDGSKQRHRNPTWSAGNNTAGSNSTYATKGPASSFGIKSVAPAMPPPQCYIWQISNHCTPQQIGWLAKGTAVVKNFILVGNEGGTSRTLAGTGGNLAGIASSQSVAAAAQAS